MGIEINRLRSKFSFKFHQISQVLADLHDHHRLYRPAGLQRLHRLHRPRQARQTRRHERLEDMKGNEKIFILRGFNDFERDADKPRPQTLAQRAKGLR